METAKTITEVKCTVSGEGVFAPSHPFLGFDGRRKEEQKEGQPLILPLKLEMQCCASEQEMNSNTLATIERGYESIVPHLDSEKGECSLCGAGPSLEDSYKLLKGDVLAVNSAIGFLVKRGVIPKYGLIWDADPICEKFVVNDPRITYLVGARCHPKVYEAMNRCKQIVWYAGGDHNIKQLLQDKNINEPMINGGSAGITRGLYIAYALGYRVFHLHGGDSSYSNDGRTHINGSLVPEKDFKVYVDGVWHRTTPEWCAQIEEYKQIFWLFHHPQMGAKLLVYDNGLLKFIHDRLVANAVIMRDRLIYEAKWTTKVKRFFQRINPINYLMGATNVSK